MKFNKILSLLILLALGLYMTTYFTETTYIWKALIYQKVDYDDYKIFKNRTIASGATANEWPVSKNLIPLSESLDHYLTETKSIGFLMIRNDTIVSEKYWPDYSEETIANSFSMAKSYMSMMVGFALKEGKISSLNEPVGNYIPEFKTPEKQDIKIIDLLTMSSGLEWIERYDMPINHTTASYYGRDLTRLVLNLDVQSEPGKIWQYKGCDPQLLAIILEKATGKNISSYLQEKFWQPVGATADALWSLDRADGIEKAYCCINTNARNFARIGKLYMNHGKWNGTQLLDSQFVYQSLQSINLPNSQGENTTHYGYLWWLIPEKNIAYARGLNGQSVIIIPEKNIILVRIGNIQHKLQSKHPTEVLKMIDWALELP